MNIRPSVIARKGLMLVGLLILAVTTATARETKTDKLQPSEPVVAPKQVALPTSTTTSLPSSLPTLESATSTETNAPETVVAPASPAAPIPSCNATVKADVVAFDQIIFYNRYGSFDPGGMIYALRRDVVAIDPSRPIGPGNVQLRPDKRPRPLVLRVNEGDCLRVNFTNMLDPVRADVENLKFANAPDNLPYFGAPIETFDPHTGQPITVGGSVKLEANSTPATRTASMHVNGLDYVDSIASDGSNVGRNSSSLAAPGQSRVYTWYAAGQGQYMMNSTAAHTGGEGDGGQPDHGLFGSVNVEPRGAKWYRSQVTGPQLKAATKKKTSPNGTVTDDLNPNGTPKLNYEAVDSAGIPILNMLKGDEIVHTDINAVISGFTEDCTHAPPSSTCGQSFREFTVIFNDEVESSAPAFPEMMGGVMHGVRDGFAINYGSAGMGAEVLANRKKVGPAAECVECKLEEFFLESWAVGDPAMLVKNNPTTGKATETLFPDDPSNVHHSYIGDPVRFRNIHVGPKETHVFHLHAHQWLQSPRDENSTYLDSQTISPGAAFTYEINYGGGGNRNVGSPGDSIFHCHLYPHFAEGMWELWRNHDVFEAGTSDRNLPDGEIAGGTPNPGLVPIPGKPMAPMPTAEFKGFPFYMPAQAGHRSPQPAFDMDWDGGLPRHRIVSGTAIDGKEGIDEAMLQDPIASRVMERNDDPNLFYFARKLTSANIELIPQDGTPAEKVAFNFHQGLGVEGEMTAGTPTATRWGWPAIGYQSFDSSGRTGLFLVNGRAPQPGAPYADPCPDGVPDRTYKAAYIQFDMKVNNAGWHDPQARIAVLQEDVQATLSGERAPEPLFFRANSNDCITFKATNLIPNNLNLDDFQVFSPTDIMGQHIHLVKFDVTSSDGAGNGWNYEDGTFTAQEVRERIAANNVYQESINGEQILSAKVHPELGPGPNNDWLGAQTTIQRWWADPLLNRSGEDRTLRTVFTHDHFGPSSHQHHGLYAALVVEPTNSQWQTLDGSYLGIRDDGGPTTYAANIIHENPNQSYREFNVALGDYAIVYTAENIPVNPPNFKEHPLPYVVGSPNLEDPSQQPSPEAISTADPGTQLLNYRNEPIPLRIAEKSASGQFQQKSGEAGDLANAFSSAVHGDPFTPILKVYEGDRVQVRLIQGAQEDQHVFNIHGFKWLFEPSSPNSGYSNAQQVGISEHFEFEVGSFPIRGQNTDYLYSSTATGNLWDGQWGLLRGYKSLQPDLATLPNNSYVPADPNTENPNAEEADVCPVNAPLRHYDVSARLARDFLPGGALVYNDRVGIKDPNAIIFVKDDEVAKLQSAQKKPEPLILRAAAGDCIEVKLTNMLSEVMPESNSWAEVPPIIPSFNFNQVKTSNRVGLHAQLVAVNTFSDDGARIGFNDDSTVGPGENRTYKWYAGHHKLDENGKPVDAPVEFGATGLRDFGDAIKHASHGAVGSLIIEPQGSTWTADADSNASASVTDTAGNTFREFVVIYHDDLSLQRNGVAMMNNSGGDDSEDTGLQAFNYRSEPLWARLGLVGPEVDPGTLGDQDFTNSLSSIQPNTGCGGACGDPATPVFTARAGTPVRFRVVHPAGKARQHGFTLFGHHWGFEPWTQDSTVQGHNPYTFEVGSFSGIGPARHMNILTTAGGLFHVPGDYLYRTQEGFMFGGGLWGIFRVTPAQ